MSLAFASLPSTHSIDHGAELESANDVTRREPPSPPSSDEARWNNGGRVIQGRIGPSAVQRRVIGAVISQDIFFFAVLGATVPTILFAPASHAAQR
jgi:hypothetical protein